MNEKLTEVSVVVTFHLPEENITLRMLRLFEQKVVEELQHLPTYGCQLVFDLLSVHLNQVEVFVSLIKTSKSIDWSGYRFDRRKSWRWGELMVLTFISSLFWMAWIVRQASRLVFT